MLGLTRWLLLFCCCCWGFFSFFLFLIRINSHHLKMGAFLIKIHISTQFRKEKPGADASPSCSVSWQRSGQTLACSWPQSPLGPPAGPLAKHSSQPANPRALADPPCRMPIPLKAFCKDSILLTGPPSAYSPQEMVVPALPACFLTGWHPCLCDCLLPQGCCSLARFYLHPGSRPSPQ